MCNYHSSQALATRQHSHVEYEVHMHSSLLLMFVLVSLIIIQLTRALSSAKQDYERVHGRLMQEMPDLFEGRVEYFDLSLQAVIKAQVRRKFMWQLLFLACMSWILKILVVP